MNLTPSPLEAIPASEEQFIRKLTDMLLAKVSRDYPTGVVRRDAHAKHHGCVRARFEVEPNLPDELRIGVFRQSQTFEAYVRFSNQDGVPKPDIDKDIRGMAIKLLGVPGEKLLDDERDATTQDFILISTDRFVTANVEEFHDLIKATIGGTLSFLWFFLNPFNSHWRVAYNLWKSMLRHPNPLHIRYWSTVPYCLGTRAVKYSARPLHDVSSQIPANPGPDYLREVMQAWLAGAEAVFEFLVQFQVDPTQTPIEDPGAPWSEDIAPFRKVATLRIPPQAFDTPAQMEFGENLSFTPWHSLSEHRPLGGINRARKIAYREISIFRHQRNGVERKEPSQ